MNNDLEQFSEERLKDMQKHVTAGMTLGHADALLIRQALDIALAAKQAKAIGYVESKTTGTDRFIIKRFYAQNIKIGDSIYITPQPAHTEQDGWIKCSERMPDEEGMYQCWGKFFANDEYGYFCSSYRPHIKPMWVPVEDDCDPIDVSVTHWMPLPAAPKPEGE